MGDKRDEESRLTVRRGVCQPEFWLLLVAGMAATFGVPWWIVLPLATAGLSISSLPKYIAMWPRARAVGADGEWWKTVALSMFNNIAASCAAFTLGVFSRWLWW